MKTDVWFLEHLELIDAIENPFPVSKFLDKIEDASSCIFFPSFTSRNEASLFGERSYLEFISPNIRKYRYYSKFEALIGIYGYQGMRIGRASDIG